MDLGFRTGLILDQTKIKIMEDRSSGEMKEEKSDIMHLGKRGNKNAHGSMKENKFQIHSLSSPTYPNKLKGFIYKP